jgi:hypothetical protein
MVTKISPLFEEQNLKIKSHIIKNIYLFNNYALYLLITLAY